MPRSLKLALTSLQRDWRSGELGLIAVAVVIAVTSLTSVSFFTDRVQRATEQQATELLAADLVLSSRAPIPESMLELARSHSLATVRTLNFRSVVLHDENLQMVEAKAVARGYPLRGRLRTAERLFGPESIATTLPPPGKAWADARLLQSLGLRVGDRITLGTRTLTVSRVLTYEPDRGGDLFNIAPRLLLNLEDVAATGLILPGSRLNYRLLLGGEVNQVAEFRRQVDVGAETGVRVQGIRDARPELRTALDRAEQFLGLAALVSIALAGLAVAMSAQRYAVRHYDHCAILRCLGADQGLISRIYLIQLFLLAVGSALLGCILGYASQGGLAMLMSGLSSGPLPAPSWRPVITGLTTALITVIGFAMPQVLRLRNVPPLRVLRRDLSPVPFSGLTTYAIAVVALAVLSPWQSGSIKLTAYTFAGILATIFLLALGAHGLIRLIQRLRTRTGLMFRFGLANIARRASLSTAQIMGLGLGVMVMLLLTLVRTDLLDSWRERVPEDAPNYFLINIQSDEVDSVRSFLAGEAGVTTELYPMIRGRLVRINGREVEPEAYQDTRARRLAEREFNLSQAAGMQPDNRLVAGEWWPLAGQPGPLFSVEEGIAGTLGIRLHDSLTYRIAGRDITGTVANLRWVEWDSFNVNFFVVASPGSLDDYPSTYISSFYLPGQDKPLLVELVRRFPSITVIDVDAILNQVRSIMDQVISAIEFIFGFTLLSGLIILIAAMQTTHYERTRESALLSALGAGRRQILSCLGAEFISLGLLTGILAAVAASLVQAMLSEFVFNMDVAVNPWLWLAAPLICTAAVTLIGLAGTRSAVRTPPLAVLRRF